MNWYIKATTNHGKIVTHRAPSREKARALRSKVDRLPFVRSTTAPARTLTLSR